MVKTSVDGTSLSTKLALRRNAPVAAVAAPTVVGAADAAGTAAVVAGDAAAIVGTAATVGIAATAGRFVDSFFLSPVPCFGPTALAPEAQVATFRFKAVRPTFDLNPFKVNGRRDGDTVKLWAQDHEGWLTMDASATLR